MGSFRPHRKSSCRSLSRSARYWADPGQGIFNRHHRLHADRGGDPGATRNLRGIPPLFKTIFFSLFVFTIGYKSGPEFFASLSLRTLSQVGVAVVVSLTGLTIVLIFAFSFTWIRAPLPVLRPAA